MRLHLIAQLGYANDASPPIEGWFDAAGGTVGRDQRCHMVLVDPLRRISRIQAQILWENDAFHLLNASTSNPIYVNGKELAPGERSLINGQEEWRTGNYVIAVQPVDATTSAAPMGPGTAHVPADTRASVDVSSQMQPPAPMAASMAASGIAPVEAPMAEPIPAPALVPAAAQPLPPLQDIPMREQGSPATLMKGPFDDLLGAPVEQPQQLPAVNEPAAESAAPLGDFPNDPFASPVAAAQVPQAATTFRSQSDPFADLMGAPLDAQLSSAPVAPFASTHSHVIPDDFNPMAFGGVAHRNVDDPLTHLAQAGNVKDMFPERSLDAIFQPTEGSIESMTRDPLQDARHQSFMDASTKLDPLDIFSSAGVTGELNTDALFGDSDRQGHVQRDHTSELGSYFRAPRALHDAQFGGNAPLEQESAGGAPALNSLDDPLASIVSESVALHHSAPRAVPMGDVAAHVPASMPVPAPPIEHTPNTAVRPLPDPTAKVESLDAFFDLDTSADTSLLGVDIAPAASPVATQTTTPYAAPAHTHTRVADDADAAPPAPAPAPSRAPGTEPSENTEHASPPVAALANDGPSGNGESAQHLLDAFKQGAGLSDCRYPQQLTPEVMHMVGQMLAGSVQGFMDLLGSRAATKQEVRIAVTLINAEANNPLKFLPTGAAALAQIFGPRMPGFLPGPAAIDNARQDLRSHEVGMMAGTQASVQGLFERFDPHIIEQQLDAQGRQRTLFAAQRNARLWEMYCSHYRWLKDEMKNQSPASWGAEFLSAYQTETDSMDSKGTGQ